MPGRPTLQDPQGDHFYYAHLVRPSPLKPGTRVRAGQVVGYPGDTGQGPEVTRGLFPAHLHLGWYDPTGARSEAGSGAHYCEVSSPPNPVSSTGERDWPAPEVPGVSPDLDTESNDPEPSPAVRSKSLMGTAPIQRAGTARRATPKLPVRASQERTLQIDPRGTPARAAKPERTKSPIPTAYGTPETKPQATKAVRAEPPKPEGPPRHEPSIPEVPKPTQKHQASDEGEPPSQEPRAQEHPSQEPPSLGPVREYSSVPWAEAALQGPVVLQDWLEGWLPDLDSEPADTQNHDGHDEERRDEKPEGERDERRPEQDREEKPAANGSERRPPADHEPTEEVEPSSPDPETEDPDQTEPETTEPIPETTAGP